MFKYSIVIIETVISKLICKAFTLQLEKKDHSNNEAAKNYFFQKNATIKISKPDKK